MATVTDWRRKMAKTKKIKRNKIEEPRIIIFTAVICAVLCLLMIPLVRNTVVSYIYSIDGSTYLRHYMRQYLERSESLEDGTA